jgi:hypothetical protein
MNTRTMVGRSEELMFFFIFMTDKFGAAMTLVKSDIGGNITVRLCQLLCLTLT